MNCITVSGITEQVDQNILMQLMELVGQIECFMYSEDNTQLQVNYQTEQNTEKAVNIFNSIQVSGVTLLFSQGTLEENVDKKGISIQQTSIESMKLEPVKTKGDSEQNVMKEIGTKLKEGFCEFWSQLNEKVPLVVYYETAKIKMLEFNKEHQITERMSNFFVDIGTKCKSIFVKSSTETQITTEQPNSNESKEINIEDAEKEKINVDYDALPEIGDLDHEAPIEN